MAKPYLIYKTPNGVYYAEILLPDGSHANKKWLYTKTCVFLIFQSRIAELRLSA